MRKTLFTKLILISLLALAGCGGKSGFEVAQVAQPTIPTSAGETEKAPDQQQPQEEPTIEDFIPEAVIKNMKEKIVAFTITNFKVRKDGLRLEVSGTIPIPKDIPAEVLAKNPDLKDIKFVLSGAYDGNKEYGNLRPTDKDQSKIVLGRFFFLPTEKNPFAEAIVGIHWKFADHEYKTQVKVNFKDEALEPDQKTKPTKVQETTVTEPQFNRSEEGDEGLEPGAVAGPYAGTLTMSMDDLLKEDTPAITPKPEASTAPVPNVNQDDAEPKPEASTATVPSLIPARPAPAKVLPKIIPEKTEKPEPESSVTLPNVSNQNSRIPRDPNDPATLFSPDISLRALVKFTLDWFSVQQHPNRKINQVYGHPNESDGYLRRADQLRKLKQETQHIDYFLKAPSARQDFASFELVNLVDLIAAWAHAEKPGSNLVVGALSKETGGNIGHASHRNGLDADIGYITENQQSEFVHLVANHGVKKEFMQQENYNLLKKIVSTGMADRIFVDQKIKNAMCSIAKENGDYDTALGKELLRTLRIWAHHENHFHLRIRCPLNTQQGCGTMSRKGLPVGCS